eukprot:1195486-Prorocentrum_minimum.AAC.2
MPAPLTQLVRVARICPLPSPDWSALREYARSPHPTGPRCENMPAPLTRLVRVARIRPLPSPDWSASREYARSPHPT